MWKSDYNETRRKKAEVDPEYRAKRNKQGARPSEENKIYMKEYYQNNKSKWKRTKEQQDKVNASRRQKYATDEDYREKTKKKVSEYNKKHPEIKKNSHLMYDFGITLEDYNNLLVKQDYKCAICGSKLPKNSKTKHLVVDHDHKTGKVRGLLCQCCNFGLGQFGDSIENLKNAIKYLEECKNGTMDSLV